MNLWKFIVKVFKYLRWHLILKPYHKIKEFFKKFIRRVKNKISRESKKYKMYSQEKGKMLEKLMEIVDAAKSADRIVLWKNDNFGWNANLFQRPQHIARVFARENCLYLYEVTSYSDDVYSTKKLEDNLFLINFSNKKFVKKLLKLLNKINRPKYLHIYSTELNLSLEAMKEFIKNGYKVLYEYIDDLSPQISGTEELPINIVEKYDYVMKDPKNCIIVVTADNIAKDVEKYRNDYVFSCNGVDYDHFVNLNKKVKLRKEMQKIVDQKKPIVGYYGALASWFDYDLIKYFAKTKPDYNFVLIGVKYDDSYDKHNVDELKNIHYIGHVKYDDLPYYAKCFDVCSIPFLINEITQATSPLKLFEYMALSKPIVTTAMHECQKYESVLISHSQKEYIDKIDEALLLKKNKDYLKLLKKEALENAWSSKGEIILKKLVETEKMSNE